MGQEEIGGEETGVGQRLEIVPKEGSWAEGWQCLCVGPVGVAPETEPGPGGR